MTSEGLCSKARVILYKCVGHCSLLYDGNFVIFFFPQYCWKQKSMKSIRIVCNFTHTFFFTFLTMLALEERHLASCFFSSLPFNSFHWPGPRSVPPPLSVVYVTDQFSLRNHFSMYLDIIPLP